MWLMIIIASLSVIFVFAAVVAKFRKLRDAITAAEGNAKDKASKEYQDQLGLYKDIYLPLATPIVVALMGIFYAGYSQYEEGLDQDRQKKAELLREVIASQDRPGVAFLTAVGEKIVVHLRRREALATTQQEDVQLRGHEEMSAYFFLGMFRAAVTDFNATKGYQLYPRLWMEEAFLGLVQDVISIGYGDRDNLDPDVSAMEEAALYKHFGQAAGTYKTFADRPGEPKKATVLFDFIRLLKNPTNKELKPAEREHANEMLRGFSAFQKRLAEGHVDVDHLALTIDAITALDDYAFNKLFAGWYQGGNEPLEVSELDNVIPGRMGKLPPREFYFYPFSYHRNQDELAVQAYKEKLWREIKEHVSPKFQESTSVPSSSSAAIPLAFSPDGKFLVSAGLRLRLRVWDPLTGIEKPRIGPENARFGAVAFSPDGKHLATIERDGSVILFDLTRDAATRRLGQLPAFNPISCQALGFSSDGTMLAAAGITLAILWDVASGTELCKVPGHSIQSIALSPDGKYVALGEKTGIAIIWDWEKKRQSGSLNHSAACTSCDFSHDGRLLATCTSDGGLKIWDLNNRSSYFSTRLAHPPSRTSNVTFSPKGQFIASGGNLGRINVLDLAKKSRVYSLSGHEDVSFITFSPNECLMASAGFSDGDATVRIWDLKEGKVVRSFQAR